MAAGEVFGVPDASRVPDTIEDGFDEGTTDIVTVSLRGCEFGSLVVEADVNPDEIVSE